MFNQEEVNQPDTLTPKQFLDMLGLVTAPPKFIATARGLVEHFVNSQRLISHNKVTIEALSKSDKDKEFVKTINNYQERLQGLAEEYKNMSHQVGDLTKVVAGLIKQTEKKMAFVSDSLLENLVEDNFYLDFKEGREGNEKGTFIILAKDDSKGETVKNN